MTWEEEMLAEVRESNRWLKLLAVPVLRERLETELDKPEFKRIYQASDGSQIRNVAKAAKVGFGTVQRRWQDWAAKGLVEETETAGRFRKIIDLKDVGLED